MATEGRIQSPLSCVSAPALIATWSVFASQPPLSSLCHAASDDCGVGGHEDRQRAQTYSLMSHWRLFPQEWQMLTLLLQINSTRHLFPYHFCPHLLLSLGPMSSINTRPYVSGSTDCVCGGLSFPQRAVIETPWPMWSMQNCLLYL